VLTRRHVMYVGWVAGIARRNGVAVVPVVDGDGNGTDRLRVDLLDAAGQILAVDVVVPYPPADWNPDA